MLNYGSGTEEQMELTAKFIELLLVTGLGFLGLFIVYANESRAWATNISNRLAGAKNQTLIFVAIFSALVTVFFAAIGFHFAGATTGATIMFLALQVVEVVPYFVLGAAFCREAGFEPLSGSLFEKRSWSAVSLRTLFFLLLIVGLASAALGIELLASKFVINPALSIQQSGAFADPFSKLFGYQPAAYKVFLLILIGVIAEESIFRLGILGAIFYKTKNKHLAVFLSAVFFAFYHFLPSHLIGPYVLSAPILHFLGLVMAGALYGYIFLWKRFEFVVAFHTLIVFVPFLVSRLQ